VEAIDINALMEEIREKVKSEISQNGSDRNVEFKPSIVEVKAGALLHSQDLRAINQQYTYGAQFDESTIKSHRKGFVGRVIVGLKRKLYRKLWDGLLRDYMSKEREFQSSIVRFLNETARYIDARDSSIFWGLNHKVDVDVTKSVERADRLYDEFQGSLTSLKSELVELTNSNSRELASNKGKLAEVEGFINQLNEVIKGVEGIVQAKAPSGFNPKYVLFENRFRGSKPRIKEHLKFYLKYLKAPVFEIGSGRGELLELCKESGLEAQGWDLDAGMASQGSLVKLGDGIAALSETEDASLGSIIAIQVIEHLTEEVMDSFLAIARKKLKSGGKVIFETINPLSLMALSSNYIRDPSHVFPQHPETVSYRMTLAGFKNIRIEFLSPYPESEKFKKLQIPQSLPPRFESIVVEMNELVDRLNSIFFAPQDFAIIGEV